MANSNKDLLNLEKKNSSSLTTESNLIICKNNQCRQIQNPNSKRHDGMPFTSAIPQSQVLGKVKDFLGVFSEANKRLQDDAKACISDYDIEALSETTSEYIEMDLMLGVADLHTPEAVAAAESAIVGYQPVISLAASTSCSSNDESTDDESDDDYDSGNYNDDIIRNDETKPLDGNISIEPSRNGKSKKQPKIVELS